MHLLQAHNFPFLVDLCQMSGFARTGANGILRVTGVRIPTVTRIAKESRFALWPNPCTDRAQIRQVDVSVEGAHFSFYVRLLYGGRFRQDP